MQLRDYFRRICKTDLSAVRRDIFVESKSKMKIKPHQGGTSGDVAPNGAWKLNDWQTTNIPALTGFPKN
jgi:hypothetical protein